MYGTNCQHQYQGNDKEKLGFLINWREICKLISDRKNEKRAGLTGKQSVPIIKQAVVYDSKGEVLDLPVDIIKAVNDSLVPNEYRRKGAREQSFVYSPGAYTITVDTDDKRYKY